MALTTRLRLAANGALKALNLEIGSLTSQRREDERIGGLRRAGQFDRAVYALLPGMTTFDAQPLAAALAEFGDDLARMKTSANSVGYSPANSYYRTPDADVLYLLVRSLKPARIVEIGCGNSTRISRQAIRDGGLSTQIIAIDPHPRVDIAAYVDRFEHCRLEDITDYSVFESLESGDVLFIDSSHETRIANDVAKIFCDVMPRLKPGVVLHFHDIYLPFEYPIDDQPEASIWGEQYMLHAYLQGVKHQLLWPGLYLQRLRPELHDTLPFLREGRAQSYWFRLG